MKIDVSIIGKKIVYGGHSGYFRVESMKNWAGGDGVLLVGKPTEDHEIYGLEAGTEYAVTIPEDSHFELFKDDKEISFDFSKFGCNADAVRELVDVLDERYKAKKEK